MNLKELIKIKNKKRISVLRLKKFNLKKKN